VRISSNYAGVDSGQIVPNRYRVVLGAKGSTVREVVRKCIKTAAGSYAERRCVSAFKRERLASKD
jgi:hypothetical protein